MTDIGTTFFVDVPAPTSTINLSVAGIEKDPFFNDVIAGFARHTVSPELGRRLPDRLGERLEHHVHAQLLDHVRA